MTRQVRFHKPSRQMGGVYGRTARVVYRYLNPAPVSVVPEEFLSA